MYWQDYEVALVRHAERLQQVERDRMVAAAVAQQKKAGATRGRGVRRALVWVGGLLAAAGMSLQAWAQA